MFFGRFNGCSTSMKLLMHMRCKPSSGHRSWVQQELTSRENGRTVGPMGRGQRFVEHGGQKQSVTKLLLKFCCKFVGISE